MGAFCGISGSIRYHSSSVRSVEYRFVCFSILAIRQFLHDEDVAVR
ncbi:hypothetical protein [Azospirillum melinis]